MGGIVVHHVNAVEHAEQVSLAGAEQAVQTLAVVGGLNLLGVAGADGGDHVAVHQTGLEEVGAAEALQLVAGPQAVAQAQHVLHLADAEHALVLQVVDGEDGLHPGEEGQVRVLDLQQRGYHAALPVVGMDDVRLPVQQGQGVEDAAAEEAETLVLVAAQAVDVGTAEVILVVHEVPGDAVLLEHLNTAVLLAPAQLYLKVQHMGHLAGVLLRNRAVQGQNDAHVVALLGQHRRKRTNHVRQAARLDKRHAFAGSKQNFHQ